MKDIFALHTKVCDCYKQAFRIQKLLHTIKQLSHKIKIKTFSKSHCFRLVRLVVVPNSWLLRNTSLNIYSFCLCFIHQTTITLQKKLLCVIQFQFLHVTVSTHYNIHSDIKTPRNKLHARTQACTLDHEILVSKKILMRKSI